MMPALVTAGSAIYLLSASQQEGKRFELMQIQSYWVNPEREQISDREGIFSTDFSLTQGTVITELAQVDKSTPTSRAVPRKAAAALWLSRINPYSYVGAAALRRLIAGKHFKDESQC